MWRACRAFSIRSRACLMPFESRMHRRPVRRIPAPTFLQRVFLPAPETFFALFFEADLGFFGRALLHEKPVSLISCSTPVLLYCTPNFLLMCSLTRLESHKLLSKPHDSGPASRSAASCFACGPSSRCFRPLPLRSNLARIPSSCARLSHADMVDLGLPSIPPILSSGTPSLRCMYASSLSRLLGSVSFLYAFLRSATAGVWQKFCSPCNLSLFLFVHVGACGMADLGSFGQK